MPGTGVGARGMPRTRPTTTPSMDGIENSKFFCEKPPTGIEFPTCANFQAEVHCLQSTRRKKEYLERNCSSSPLLPAPLTLHRWRWKRII